MSKMRTNKSTEAVTTPAAKAEIVKHTKKNKKPTAESVSPGRWALLEAVCETTWEPGRTEADSRLSPNPFGLDL